MEKLKPCPFCGGEARTVVDYDMIDGDRKLFMSAYVKCEVCGIQQRIKFEASKIRFKDYVDVFERAVSLWNQRT